MPERTETSPASLAEVLEKISERDRAFNFDVSLELTTPSLRVGTLRVHGKVEAMAPRKK